MGPYNEMTQLKRKAAVVRILQRNDLSEWARNYWGTVCDTIANSEDRYNDRIQQTYSTLKPKQKGWATYE